MNVLDTMNVLDIVKAYKKVYEGLADGRITPSLIVHGSCHTLKKLCGELYHSFDLPTYISDVISPSWEFYSGESLYPVSVPEGFCPEDAYEESANLWIGDYGQRRKDYCEYVASELGKLTEEEILKWIDKVGSRSIYQLVKN